METIKAIQSKFTIIYLALLFGQVSFAAVVIFLLLPEYQNHPSEPVFMIMSPTLIVVGIVAGMLIAKGQLKEIGERSPEEMAKAYVALSTMRCAFIEGPVLFSIICLLLTGNQIFMIFLGAGLAYFGYLFPSKSKISKELGISDDPFSM